MDAIDEQLRQIFEALRDIKDYQRSTSIQLAEHARWIAQREREIDAVDDRFKMVEQMLDKHQSNIDQRAGTFREFEEVKKAVGGIELWMVAHKAETAGLWQFIAHLATVGGILALVLKVFKVL
jgi:septal ring factor EnvC (AmiA/AmiB activator)